MWWVRTWLQVVPFHDSASEWSVPSELRGVPTAMQAVAETQDTAYASGPDHGSDQTTASGPAPGPAWAAATVRRRSRGRLQIWVFWRRAQ
jgi:hypothetical protein